MSSSFCVGELDCYYILLLLLHSPTLEARLGPGSCVLYEGLGTGLGWPQVPGHGAMAHKLGGWAGTSSFA
jgi:hypothetical protein